MGDEWALEESDGRADEDTAAAGNGDGHGKGKGIDHTEVCDICLKSSKQVPMGVIEYRCIYISKS